MLGFNPFFIFHKSEPIWTQMIIHFEIPLNAMTISVITPWSNNEINDG